MTCPAAAPRPADGRVWETLGPDGPALQGVCRGAGRRGVSGLRGARGGHTARPLEAPRIHPHAGGTVSGPAPPPGTALWAARPAHCRDGRTDCWA